MGFIIRIALLGAAIYLLGWLIRRLIRRPTRPETSLQALPGATLLPADSVKRIRGRGRLIVTAAMALLCTLLLPWGGGGGAYRIQLLLSPLVMLPWAYPVARAWQGQPMRRWLALGCCAVTLLWALFGLILGLSETFSTNEPGLLMVSLPALACALAFLFSVRLYTREQTR